MGKHFLLVCIVLALVTVELIECKWGRSRGRSGSRSRPSSHTSHTSSSSSRGYGGHSYPSSSSGLSGSGLSSLGSFKYPSSLSGLSGFGNSGSKYPSSSSGLSGFGNSGSKYPSSSSGLSGFGNSGSKYPSSSSGLSGFGNSGSKYPSSSSGLSGFGNSGSKYPSSSSGLSGSGSSGSKYSSSSSGLSGSGNSGSKYPSASSGLSGFGNSGSKYPSSSSGLSGSSDSKSKYPSSSSGLSGSGIPSYGLPNKYPPSTGLSGSGATSPVIHHPSSLGGPASVSKYPSSSSGLSGTGSGISISKSNKNSPSSYVTPVSSSGVHIYPSSKNGYSGSGNQHSPVHPSDLSHNSRSPGLYVNPSHNNYHRGAYGSSGAFSFPPKYYSSPQYVYISEYRHSGSRYSDILTGLALYNLLRSHRHHHHDHYYYDDYYRRRHYSSGNNYQSNKNENNEAVCTLRIKENNNIEVLKIPCEIVSTFSGTNTTSTGTFEQYNKTICVTNTTIVNNTGPHLFSNSSSANSTTSNIIITNSTSDTSIVSTTDLPGVKSIPILTGSNTTNETSSSTPGYIELLNNTNCAINITTANNTVPCIFSNSSLVKSTTSTITLINSTSCSYTTNATDPLSVKGPPINTTKDMECTVEIMTKNTRLLKMVDCKTLLEYSKTPEPNRENEQFTKSTVPTSKNENILLPSKTKLKSWVSNPPWWMSLFISV